MTRAEISAVWRFETAFHVGTGLSRPAYADRIVRRSDQDAVEIDGGGVQGRGAAVGGAVVPLVRPVRRRERRLVAPRSTR